MMLVGSPPEPCRTRGRRSGGDLAYVLGAPGDWLMTPAVANGQPAAVVHRRDGHGTLRPDGVVVLAVSATGIARVVKFHDSALVAAFGVPGVRAR